MVGADSGWTAGDIAGFIGAAAWIPHVGGWVYRHLAPPRVTVLTGPTAQIGFTWFGPILNLRLNFSCERRDVVINGLTIKLVSESGDQRILGWRGTIDTFSHLKDAAGTAVGSLERESDATAIKVTTNAAYESFFRFQELKFIEAKEPLLNDVLEHERFLRESGKHLSAEMMQSEQMHKLTVFHRDSFWWQAGTYIAVIEPTALSAIKVARNRFRFALTTVDVDALRSNADLIPKVYEHALKVDGVDDPTPSLRWRSPSIRMA